MSKNKQAIVAGGCFWCTEAVFRQLAGVSEVESGYIGGTMADPTYQQVCSGVTGHAEAIRVTYDPAVLDLADLLDVFMTTHDPTQLNRQGNDVGTQYRSAIFLTDDLTQADADGALARWNADHAGQTAVTTVEGPAIWYPAEDYHQDYWDGEGKQNSYCLAVIPPKLEKLRRGYGDRLKEGQS